MDIQKNTVSSSSYWDDDFCHHCGRLIPEKLKDEIRAHQGLSLIVVQSLILLICAECKSISHIHCILGSNILNATTMIDFIESLPYVCLDCTSAQ